MLKKLEKTMDKVKYLLQNFSHLRDDDNRLVANIWNNELSHLKQNDVIDFLLLYSQGRITTADTITRARRKIQELHPELRGKNYNKRHVTQKKVRKNIVNLN